MKKFLLYSSALVAGGLLSSVAEAACIQTPSCSSLGYSSSSSCSGGVKCPFGNYWNCTASDLNDKITELEKTIETIKQESSLKSCQIGHLFNSDKTCSNMITTGKTPIGVVVYVDGFGHGQVISLKSVGKYEWGPTSKDESLENYSTAAEASLDLDSCGNTAKIIATGDKSTYPAAWVAHEYSTEGTNAGDWCLPAAGIISSIYYHKQEVNMGLAYGNGTQFTKGTVAWSSSEYNKESAWSSRFNSNYDNYGLGTYHTNGSYYSDSNKYADYDVRPVLAF